MKDSGLKWQKCKETLNADSLNSKHRILKLKTESNSAREELSNGINIESLAFTENPCIDLHGETLNAHISDSLGWILKLETESCSAREELSNDMQ